MGADDTGLVNDRGSLPCALSVPPFVGSAEAQCCLQALSAARTAVGKLEAANVPWQRPPDYYAEMVKSDQHMSRIKEQLVYEQRQIEQADER